MKANKEPHIVRRPVQGPRFVANTYKKYLNYFFKDRWLFQVGRKMEMWEYKGHSDLVWMMQATCTPAILSPEEMEENPDEEENQEGCLDRGIFVPIAFYWLQPWNCLKMTKQWRKLRVPNLLQKPLVYEWQVQRKGDKPIMIKSKRVSQRICSEDTSTLAVRIYSAT